MSCWIKELKSPFHFRDERTKEAPRDATGLRIAQVTIPAYGDAAAIVTVHAYDKHGGPVQP